MRLQNRLAAVLGRWSKKLDRKAGVREQHVTPKFDSTRYFYLGQNVAMARLTDGHHLFVDTHDRTVATHLIAHGFWEQWIHHVVCSLISPGDRIIEVGANFGYYTIAMAVMTGAQGHVTAFEGNPRLCSLLQQSMDFNGYRDRVQVINQAATDVAGQISFSVSRTNAGGGHAAIHPGWAPAGMEQIEVQGVRLDDVTQGDFDFIRMDAEGSEPLILRGAERLLANPNLTVVMEWDVMQMSARASVPDLVEWLSGMGYRFWRIETDATLSLVPDGDMPTLTACDVVMSRKERLAV